MSARWCALTGQVMTLPDPQRPRPPRHPEKPRAAEIAALRVGRPLNVTGTWAQGVAGSNPSAKIEPPRLAHAS